jgi:hypothetical protein
MHPSSAGINGPCWFLVLQNLRPSCRCRFALCCHYTPQETQVSCQLLLLVMVLLLLLLLVTNGYVWYKANGSHVIIVGYTPRKCWLALLLTADAFTASIPSSECPLNHVSNSI